MAEAGLSLGSNQGDKVAAIRNALRLIGEHPDMTILRSSRLYRTDPWGDIDQDWFVNCCAIVRTALSPRALLELCLSVETRLGRDRARSRRWGPRPIDVDILFYDDLTIEEQGLTLPHPHMFERAFVLVPLAEIAGGKIIAGRRIGDLAAAADRTAISPL